MDLPDNISPNNSPDVSSSENSEMLKIINELREIRVEEKKKDIETFFAKPYQAPQKIQAEFPSGKNKGSANGFKILAQSSLAGLFLITYTYLSIILVTDNGNKITKNLPEFLLNQFTSPNVRNINSSGEVAAAEEPVIGSLSCPSSWSFISKVPPAFIEFL